MAISPLWLARPSQRKRACGWRWAASPTARSYATSTILSDDALAAFAADLDARDDLHATSDYRRNLVRRLGRITIDEAQACRA